MQGHKMYKCITHHCKHEAPLITNLISEADTHFMGYMNIIMLLHYILSLKIANVYLQMSHMFMVFFYDTKLINNIICCLQAKILADKHFEEFCSYNNKTRVHKTNQNNFLPMMWSTDSF